MSVKLTSIAAYQTLIANGKLDSQKAHIIEIVAGQGKDMSLQEITRQYRETFKWIELSSVAGRVNELKKLGALIENSPRACSITSTIINPVRIF